MRNKLLLLGALSAVVATTFVVGHRYLERHTTKIDDQVSIVTLDEHVIVMQRGAPPQVTRIRPAVVSPRTERVDPPADTKSKPKPAAKPVPPTTITWTLPYSCSTARYYATHFTKAQLEAMRVAAGMALPSADQQQQLRACIAGKIK